MDNEASSSVVRNYHVRGCRAEELHEGEGCNYRITDDAGNEYILKEYELAEEEVIAFTVTVLASLERSDLMMPLPRPVLNISGTAYTRQPENILVMFHWIEGAPMKSIDARIAEELGEAVCILDTALWEFYSTHEVDYTKYENSIWSVTNIHMFDEDLEEMKHLLGTSYSLIKEAISYFDDVRPIVQNTLSKSLIHNDINPGNVLYGRNGNLAGIIDFTEMCHTYRICEVGVALAYIMQISGNDYLAAGRGFINGYAKGYDLGASEKKYLLLFIRLRLSITIMYNTRHLHLGRLLTNTQAGFIRHAKELLTKLSGAAGDGFVEKMFSPR